VKLPLQKSSFSPATAPENLLLVAGRITTQLGTPRGRYDEYSSKFSISKKPRYIESRKKPILQKVMLTSFVTAPDNL
jgi:hypothetical protein